MHLSDFFVVSWSFQSGICLVDLFTCIPLPRVLRGTVSALCSVDEFCISLLVVGLLSSRARWKASTCRILQKSRSLVPCFGRLMDLNHQKAQIVLILVNF